MLNNSDIPLIPERLLREIWKKKFLRKLALQTIDGKHIEIIDTGKSNPNGGPDFLDARIKIGEVTFFGDVELHRYAYEWQRHTHQKDPKYNRVILHVVLHFGKFPTSIITKSKRLVPTLVLDQYLPKELLDSIQIKISNDKLEYQKNLKCRQYNHKIEASELKNWLHKLAVQRLEFKIRRFEERFLELLQIKRVTEPPVSYGQIQFEIAPDEFPEFTPNYTRSDFTDIHIWEQVLFEFILEALGYSKNQQPFRKLAMNVSLDFLGLAAQESNDKIILYEAILFGASGLLPASKQIADKQTKDYVVRLKQLWQKIRKIYKGEILNEAEWQFYRLRPENFPTVRIAAAARIVQKIFLNQLFKTLIQTVENQTLDNTEKLKRLTTVLYINADGFWQNHYRLDKQSKTQIKVLAGKERIIEIIINIIIPLCLMYARVFKKKNIREMALNLFSEIKSSRNSALIKNLDSQLIHGKFKVDTAPLYQGAVQLYKFYCLEEKCEDCEVYKNIPDKFS